MVLQITCNTLGWKGCLKDHTTHSNISNNMLRSIILISLEPGHQANTGSIHTDRVEGLLVQVARSDAGYLEPATSATSCGRSATVSIRVLTV